MASLSASTEPSEVIAEQGEVIVEGPYGVAVTLTPDAAEETARRLRVAAAQARQQGRRAVEDESDQGESDLPATGSD